MFTPRDASGAGQCSRGLHLAHKLLHKLQREGVALSAQGPPAARLEQAVQLQQLLAEVVYRGRRLAQCDVLLVRGIADGGDARIVKRSVFDCAEGEGARDADGADGVKTVRVLHTTEYGVVVAVLLLLLLLRELLREGNVLDNVCNNSLVLR
jgi:hypothetical protein